MKKSIYIILGIFVFVTMAANAFAGPSYLFDDKLKSSSPKNETFALNTYINFYINDDALYDAFYIDKIDNGIGNDFDNGEPVFSFTDDIQYFAVKAGRQTYYFGMDSINNLVSIQAIEDLLTGLNVKNGISHVSAWKTSTPTPYQSEVPEPGTLALFGFGLICMAGIKRQKRKTNKI